MKNNTPNLSINLPDLSVYRNEFQQNGVQLPLSKVEFVKNGLLQVLPEPGNNQIGWPWTDETAPQLYSDMIVWPKLSIVTPSYNQGGFIEQTIRSVLLQNYPNLEYIIIDGGSTDDTIKIIEKYSQWISYWKTEKDRGQGHAINQGFSLASGKYYAWINSDDYYLTDSFFKVITTFIRTKTDFVYGYALDYVVAENRFNQLNKIPPIIDCFIRFPSLAQPSCFWHANIHQPIWEELHCALDYELWLRLVKGHSRTRVKEPLSVANIHMDAKSADQKMKQKWHEDHLLICGENAHGPVLNWDTLATIYNMRNRLLKLFNI